MSSILRWGIKKLARGGIALGSMAAGRLADSNGARRSIEVRVLTYHRFGNIPRDPFCISPADFQDQISYLANREIALSLAEFEEYLHTGSPPRQGAVLVTIDDGFCSTFREALPILRDHEVPAVVFVTPSLIGKYSSGSGGGGSHNAVEDYMSWRELEQLVAARLTIGSHSMTHRSLGRMSASQVEEEVERSREILEGHLGQLVATFAYPFGTRADFNSITAHALRQAGYRCAFTSQHGAILPGSDLLHLPRVKVESGEDLWMFKLLVRGGLDAWSWVDNNLWRLQASKHE